jgi:hypothetical protein
VDGITGEEDQKRGEKISAEARAAIDENCLAWVRKVTGNPAVTVSPLAQERVYEISDLVWSLAYRAGREDAAREALDRLKRERERAEGDKRGREQDNDSEGVMCCVQYIDGLSIGINVLSQELDQAGDGVQPTEEQRAEDQERDEGQG